MRTLNRPHNDFFFVEIVAVIWNFSLERPNIIMSKILSLPIIIWPRFRTCQHHSCHFVRVSLGLWGYCPEKNISIPAVQGSQVFFSIPSSAFSCRIHYWNTWHHRHHPRSPRHSPRNCYHRNVSCVHDSVECAQVLCRSACHSAGWVVE